MRNILSIAFLLASALPVMAGSTYAAKDGTEISFQWPNDPAGYTATMAHAGVVTKCSWQEAGDGDLVLDCGHSEQIAGGDSFRFAGKVYRLAK